MSADSLRKVFSSYLTAALDSSLSHAMGTYPYATELLGGGADLRVVVHGL